MNLASEQNIYHLLKDMKSNEHINPNKIYRDYMNGFITKFEAVDKFIALIEHSDFRGVRAECIEKLAKLNIKNKKIFDIFRLVLLSDENPNVRITAILNMMKIFKDECVDFLKDVIQIESSVRILKTIFIGLGFFSENLSRILLEKILEKYSQSYKLQKDEVTFFIESEFQLAKKEAIKFYDKMYYYGTSKLYEISSLYDGLEYIYAVRKNHVIGLRIKNKNLFGYNKKISKSIRYLTSLRFLNASGTGLRRIPYGIRYLHQLRHIDFSDNKLKTIPNFIGQLPSLRYLNLNKNPLSSLADSLYSFSKRVYAPKYISEGIRPEEAPVIGMMEMLCGKRLHNWENFSKYYLDADFSHKDDYYVTHFYYKLNNQRHIIGIEANPDSFKKNECWFTVVPKQIELLKYLRPSDNDFSECFILLKII
ncbi:MAG: HEAT repeat domain-containing protein [Promethearchaeota archaeon]